MALRTSPMDTIYPAYPLSADLLPIFCDLWSAILAKSPPILGRCSCVASVWLLDVGYKTELGGKFAQPIRQQNLNYMSAECGFCLDNVGIIVLYCKKRYKKRIWPYESTPRCDVSLKSLEYLLKRAGLGKALSKKELMVLGYRDDGPGSISRPT